MITDDNAQGVAPSIPDPASTKMAREEPEQVFLIFRKS